MEETAQAIVDAIATETRTAEHLAQLAPEVRQAIIDAWLRIVQLQLEAIYRSPHI